MKDARMTGAVDVTEAEGRPATSEDCASEDWLWRVGGDPVFYLQESGWSRGSD